MRLRFCESFMKFCEVVYEELRIYKWDGRTNFTITIYRWTFTILMIAWKTIDFNLLRLIDIHCQRVLNI